jgi:biopolymer transport protein ExbD
MARKHHYRRRTRDVPEMDMTTFLNLMVVLVPFLLITAVFSRITIVELDLPTSAAVAASPEELMRVEVVVRHTGLEISNGREVIAMLPKLGGRYDLESLSGHLMELKDSYPEKEDATVLLEPTVEYDHLIQVMDAVRTAEVRRDDQFMRMDLFTAISIGDAP